MKEQVKKIQSYIEGALMMPLVGISQLTSMVILHFDIPNKEADFLVLKAIRQLVIPQKLSPKPDEGRLLTDEEFVEWLSCQDSAKLYFLSEEECQREAQDAKTASIYEKKIRELKKKIHKTNVYYLREIQRLADEQALKSNKGGG